MPQAQEQQQGPTATRPPLPADVDPWMIVNDPKLGREAKIELLQQLELDVRLVENSLEEGMTGNTRMPPLAEVHAALDRISDEHHEDVSPTKV
jgi:hypothetical protein